MARPQQRQRVKRIHHAGFINDDFRGVDRIDTGYDFGVSARFLLRCEIYLGGSFPYSHRDSHRVQAAGGFTQNILMLRLATQLCRRGD